MTEYPDDRDAGGVRAEQGGVGGPIPEPVPERRADAGSPRMALVALIVMLVGFAGVIVLQQAPHGEVAEEEPGVVAPGPGDQVLLVSKMGLRFAGVEGAEGQVAPQVVPALEQLATRPEDQIRAAITAFELGDAETGAEFLERAETAIQVGAAIGEPEAEEPEAGEAKPKVDEQLQADAAWVRSVYVAGSDEAAPNEKAPAGFADRHGEWYAGVVETAGLDKEDPAREPYFGGGLLLMLLLLGMFAIVFGAFLAGFVLLILGIVFAATGSPAMRPRFVRPGPGGSVYLETVAVFILGFLGVQGVTALFAVAGLTGTNLLAANFAVQWLLVLVVLWPVLRGVPMREWRAQVGLIAPRGVLREIGAGMVGYLAMFPLWIGLVVTTVVLVQLQAFFFGSGDGPAAPPANPVLDLVGGANGWVLLLLMSLVVVWAPVVEELVFRGSLFRHMRSRVPFAVAALLTAGVFAGMHGYPGLLLLPVFGLGVIFSVIREWRGSVIGSITGHMLHNGTVVGFLVGLFSLVG